MQFFTDQTGNALHLPGAPKRIISIVPSQTELLHDLGLGEEVIGITKFCVHPSSWFLNKEKVGGTKNLQIQKIRALKPDLIIANKEENTREEVEALQQEYPVWVSDVKTLADALDMIQRIGQITGTSEKAGSLINEINSRFSHLSNGAPPFQEAGSVSPAPASAYLIWQKPYMAAGNDTFIHDMMQKCGFNNYFKDVPRYPVISPDQLRASNCEFLLLSSEPYPFREKHVNEFRKILPLARILLVDGEMFSWYGSRLLHAPAYFKRLAGAVPL